MSNICAQTDSNINSQNKLTFAEIKQKHAGSNQKIGTK